MLHRQHCHRFWWKSTWQYGFSTPEHSEHTTGAYGNTGMPSIAFTGVHTAPKGSTTRVASIREEGHAFHDKRTPSFLSSSAKSIAPEWEPRGRDARSDARASEPVTKIIRENRKPRPDGSRNRR